MALVTLGISVIGAILVLKFMPPRNEPLPAENMGTADVLQQLSPAYVREQVQ